MATTEVNTSEAIPLTTLQKMEAEDKELLTGEGQYDKSVDQLSKDELNKIEIDLTKVLETVERSGDGDTVQNDAGVRACDAGAQESGGVAVGGAFVKTPSVPEVAEEKTITESRVGTVIARKDELPVNGELEESITVEGKRESQGDGVEEKEEAVSSLENVDQGKDDEQVPHEAGQTASEGVEPSDHLLHLESRKEVETQDGENNNGDEPKQEEVKDKEIASLSEKADVKESSYDSDKEVNKGLEKLPETEAGEVSVPECQTEVCTEPEPVPVVPCEETQEVTKDSDETEILLMAEEEKNVVEDHSASKTDKDDTDREKSVEISEIRESTTATDSLKEEGVENELPDTPTQSENSQAGELETEEKTTGSVQVEEKHIISENSKTEEEPEQAISLKDDPVAEKLEIPIEIIPAKTEEAETLDIADKIIPDVEEETTIIQQQTEESEINANERREEKSDAVQVTEEPRHFEAGVYAVEVDVASADSFTTEANDKSPDTKTEEVSSPNSNTEHLLQQEAYKSAKIDTLAEQVNDEPTSTSADDDSVKEQTNMVGHILTESRGGDVTAPLDDEEENSNNKEISEQVVQEFSVIEEEPEEITHKPEVRIPETSPYSTSEEHDEAVESQDFDGVTITTTGEETDKIEEQVTDATEFKAGGTESAGEMNFAEAKGSIEVAEAEILGKEAETNKEEKIEILKIDGADKASLILTADDRSSELPLLVEPNLKETSKGEEDNEQPEKIDKTPEIVEQVTTETPVETKEDAPGKDEDTPVSISEETVKKVEHMEETDKECPKSACEIEALAEQITAVTRVGTGEDASDAIEDQVVIKEEQRSARGTGVKSGTDTDQHMLEEEKQDTAELVEKEAEPTANFEGRVAEHDTQLDEPIALESQIQTRGIEVPAQVKQTLSREQMENEVESSPEVVSEPHLDDFNNQEKVSVPDPDDSKNLKKTSEPGPDDAENPKQASEPDPDDCENLEKVSEPDQDDSEKLKQVAEPDPDDPEDLKNVSETDPDDTEKLKQVSEPDPDNCENLNKISEPDPDVFLNLKQISQPNPDDSGNLKKVSDPDPDNSDSQEKVSETDPNGSQKLKQVSEPDPDNSDSQEKVSETDPSGFQNPEKVSEPDPDDSEKVNKVSGPDPDDTDILEKFSAPNSDDSENQKTVPEPDPDDSENKEKVYKTEIPEDSKREIPVSTTEEVPEKTDAQPGEATFLEEVSTVGEVDEAVTRSIEVTAAKDTVPELSVEDSVQEEDSSCQIPEKGNEEEYVPMTTTDDQTTQEQIIKGDAEQDEEPASEETVRIVQQNDDKEDIQTGEVTEEREVEGTEGPSPPAHITVEGNKPDEAEEDKEEIEDSAPSAEQDDSEISVTAAECNESHVEEVKEQSTEEVSQKDEAGKEVSLRENEPGDAVEHLGNADEETDPSASRVNDDVVTIIKSKEAPEDPELSTPSLNDDNITSLKSKESREEIQEEQQKGDANSEDKETAKEVLVPEDEQKDTNGPYETADTEPSASSVNDDHITSLKSDESTEEIQEEQQKDDVGAKDKETVVEVLAPEDEQKDTNVPYETEDTEPSASSANDDNITSLKSEESAEEIQDEQQKGDANAEDKENAKEVSVTEDEQKDKNVPYEIEDTGSSASSVSDDNITSLKSEERTEEIQEEQQKGDANAEGKETAKEELVTEDEQENKNVAYETEDTEPSASSVNDDNITSLKREESSEGIQEEQQKVDANAEEKETAKEKLVPEVEQRGTNVQNETEDTEPSALSVNDDNITSLKSKETTEEIQEEQQKHDVSAEAKETVVEVLVPEDEQKDTNVPYETEDAEPSASSVTEEILDEQQKGDANAEDKETAKEVLVPGDEQKGTNVPNETEDTEPSDHTTSLKSEKSTEEIVEEQQKDEASAKDRGTVVEVLAPEDDQKATNVPNENEDTEPSDNTTSLKSEKSTEEILEEQQKDDVDAKDKETVVEVLVPEDEQKDKNVTNETEGPEQSALSVNDGELSLVKGEEHPDAVFEDEKKIDLANDGDIVEETPTANEVVVQDDQQAQPDQLLPNEPQDSEPSPSVKAVNDEDVIILKRKESYEEVQGEESMVNQLQDDDNGTENGITKEAPLRQDEQYSSEKVHLPDEAEDAEVPASSADDDNLSTLKNEEVQEEGKDADQPEADDNLRERELATEVTQQEDKREEQLAQLQSETEEAEPSASVANDDEVAIHRSDVGPETVVEINQARDDGNAKEVKTLVQESKGVELDHLPKETGEAEPSIKDESTAVLNSVEEPEESRHEEKEADIVRDDMQERKTAYDALGQEDEQGQHGHISDKTEDAEPSVAGANDGKTTSLKSEGVIEVAPEESKQSDHPEPEVAGEEKDVVNRGLVLEDEQGEDAKDEPAVSLVNDDDIKTLKSEEIPEEVQEEERKAKQTEDGDAKATETANEALVVDIPLDKGIDLPKEIAEAESPAPNPSADETVILRSEEDPERVEEAEKKKDQVIDYKVTANESTVQEGKKDDEPEHFPSETEDTKLHASRVSDDKITCIDSGEKTEQGAEESTELSQEIADETEKKESSNEGLESSVDELEAEKAESKTNLESKEPDSVGDNVEKEDSIAEDASSPCIVEDKVETSIQENEHTKAAHDEAAPNDETEIFDERHEASVEKDTEEETTVREATVKAEAKSGDEDREDLTKKETRDGNTLESVASVEVSKLEVQKDFVATAKETEVAPEESKQSDHPEAEVEVEEKDVVDRGLVLQDEQGEDAKDEPAASFVNDDGIKTLKSEQSPEEVQEEEKEAKQTKDGSDAKATETANEAFKEVAEAESPAPNPSADETVILRSEEDPERVEEEEKKKDQVTDGKVTANELPVQEGKKDDEPEHFPSETEDTVLHVSRVSDEKITCIDSGEKTEQRAEESMGLSQEKADETEEKESSNEGLESSVHELEAGKAESKTNLESKEPESVGDNAEKEYSITEDASSPGKQVETSIQANEHTKAAHDEAAPTDETQIFDERHEASVEKDTEETTVPEALVKAEAKSDDEDREGLTQKETRDGDSLESVAAVEVSNSEVQDFVATAKETEEELESVIPRVEENDKKELTIREAQGEKLQSSEQDEVPVLSDKNQDANEPVTTDTDKIVLQSSEIVEVPAAADKKRVDVTLRARGDEVRLESPALPKADAIGGEDQKELIISETASDKTTEKTENESLITSSRECDFQPENGADEKVDIPSESPKSSSILAEAKSIITSKDTETMPPNDMENEDNVEDIKAKESLAKVEDETNVKADTKAASSAEEQAAFSSLAVEKDDETQMEIVGDVNSVSIKKISSLGLQDAKLATSEVSVAEEVFNESASVVEPVTKESHTDSTEEPAVNKGLNPEPLSSEIPKPEVNAAEEVEIKEVLLTEEASLVTAPPELTEQEGQEKFVQVVTSDAHKAEPEEEIETKEQRHDSANEIVNAPVELQDEPEASREPVGDEKIEEVSNTELDKEDNKGQSEIQVETPDSATPEKLEVKGVQAQESATVTPANDKLKVDQAIKCEASDEDPIELAEKKGGPEPSQTVIPSTTSCEREAELQDLTVENQEVVTPLNNTGTVQADETVATSAVPQLEQASGEATPGETTHAEAHPIPASTVNKDVPTETQQSTTRSLDLGSENSRRDEIESQSETAAAEKTKTTQEIELQSETGAAEKTKTTQEIGSGIESAMLPFNVPAENSLSNLLQISTKDTIQMAQQPSQKTNPTPNKDSPHTEDPKTDDHKHDEEEDEEEEEHKKTDSNSSDGVIVEASRDLDAKSPRKKHGILSGVGSKVKNSISKVKKAITGKSSHPKPPSPSPK